MSNNPHIKDADKMIDFFMNAKTHYLSEYRDEGLISFCLGVFGISQFDVKEIETSANDLRSIMMVISRELSEGKLEQFNSVVKDSVDKYEKWLYAVYNRRLPEESGEQILFSDCKDLTFFMNNVSQRKLVDSYFKLESDYTDTKQLPVVEVSLSKDSDCEDMATDYLKLEDGVIIFAVNEVPWTDRNKVWIGNKDNLNMILTSKFRKNKHKRLQAIIKEAYNKVGDELLFKTIIVEDKALDKADGYALEFNKDSSDKFIVIKRK